MDNAGWWQREALTEQLPQASSVVTFTGATLEPVMPQLLCSVAEVLERATVAAYATPTGRPAPPGSDQVTFTEIHTRRKAWSGDTGVGLVEIYDAP
jgi:hypothetical protein